MTRVDGDGETLLIHQGGLGDVCLSESAFLTIARHFEGGIRAVGSRRVLERFGVYFTRVDSIDGRAWSYLFSDSLAGPRWKRIVLFGKDREGSLRARLGQLSGEFVFVDLYPDDGKRPVEQHQLAQLAACGMKPRLVTLPERKADRIILYPEEGFRKLKWPPVRFAEVCGALRKRGLNVILMTPPGMDLPDAGAVSFEELADVEAFFSDGGLFFSNDSGMAHFAARCGLSPLTLFWEADPMVWRAKGARVLKCEGQGPAVREVVDLILGMMEDAKIE
jgi:hypothetical protein